MKQRLKKVYWIGVLVTLIMAFAAITVSAWIRITDTRNFLTAMLTAASRWTVDSNEDLESLASSIAQVSPSMHASFLMESGLILADSPEGTRPEADAFSDPEIVQARSGKIGSGYRFSAADWAYVLYMAKRVSPQLILRLSYPVFEVIKVIWLYGAGLVLLFLILYYIQRRAIAGVAADQIRQMESIRELLDGQREEAEAVFPELYPSAATITYRIRRLKEDHEEVRRTLNMRQDFIAHASHELRSPLTSVRGFAEMLSEDPDLPAQEKELYLQTILKECDRMLAVINDILQLSKVRGRGSQNLAACSLRTVADEVCQVQKSAAAKKQITLTCEGDARVMAQEQDLWEILFNLVDNAIRYGKPGGHVRVRISPGLLEVEDDGIGMLPEHASHVFEEFYRVDESRDSTSPGTGLGLSIVRAITEGLGGQIQVRSSYGEGSCFTVSFPTSVGDGSVDQ